MMEMLGNSLILLYLISAAYIDYKTKSVYRVGSIAFIGLSVAMFIGKTWNNPEAYFIGLLSIFLASFVVFMQGLVRMMGWGDVFTYIGVFFYIGSWEYNSLPLELMAIYMFLANVIFFVFHIRKFDWKTKRFKEEAAFLPSMAGAMMILEFLRLLNWEFMI